EPYRHEEVAGALRRPPRHAWRPDVHELALVHRPSDRLHDRVRQPEVALHLPTPEVQPPVMQAEGLVDVLLLQLERQRGRSRDDLEAIDLELDAAGRQARVDRVGGARDQLALGPDAAPGSGL